MKALINRLTVVVMILGLASLATAQVKLSVEWLNDIGTRNYRETAYASVTDTKGNIIALTRSWDSVSSTDWDSFQDFFKIQKYTSTGQLIWQKALGGRKEQFMLPGGLCIDSNDNIFFLLNTYNTIVYFDTTRYFCPNRESMIFKLTPQGDVAWSKYVNRLVFGWAMNDNTKLLAIDRENNLVFTGRSQSSGTTFSIDGIPYFETPRYGTFFVAKISGGGDVLWVKPIDQRPDTSHYSGGDFVAVDDQNNIIVLGTFGTTFAHDEIVIPSEGPLDLFLAKLDQDGVVLWVNRLGSTDQDAADWPWGLAIDENNHIYTQGTAYYDVTITGWPEVSNGSSDPDIFLTQFDPHGKAVWYKRIGPLNEQSMGNTISDCPMGLAYSLKDRLLICRSHLFSDISIEGTHLKAGSKDGVPALWAYTTEGTLSWVTTLSVPKGYVQFNDIAIDNVGSILMCGYAGKIVSGTTDRYVVSLEDSSFLTYGGEDGILAKFSVQGIANTVGISAIASLPVHPNPFSDHTTIQLPEEISLMPMKLQIRNMLGTNVMEIPLPMGARTYTLARNGMALGIYQYQIISKIGPIAQGFLIIQ